MIRQLARVCLGLLLASTLAACTSSPEKMQELIKQLKSKDSHARNAAALKLASYGPDAHDAVPALALLLKDPNKGIQSSAAYALREIGGAQATKAIDDYQLAKAKDKESDDQGE